MLTADQLRQRDGKLTASRVACLMSGDEGKIMYLWREMTGDPAFKPEDLSGVWPVRLGEATEALNLHWYTLKTGHPLTRVGEVVVCPAADWAAATLDAWDAAIPAPIECKHVGGFEPREKIIARYQPQCHWQMICTGARVTMLSIIEGAREPAIEEIAFDAVYGAELWRRAEAFMECVRDLTPPVALAPVEAPVAAAVIYDMTGNNSWVMNAGIWIENHSAKKRFEGAEKELKAAVPQDAALAKGHGIVVKRDRAGRLSISATKEE